MEVLKVFNNNVVMADDGGRQVVLTGRGLGYQAKPGDRVDRVVRRFTPDAEHDVEQLSAFLTELPPEHLALAAEILRRAQEELGTTFTQSMVIPLADHISFATKRVRQQFSRCAEKVKALLELRLGKPITADEVVYLTLDVARLLSEE